MIEKNIISIILNVRKKIRSKEVSTRCSKSHSQANSLGNCKGTTFKHSEIYTILHRKRFKYKSINTESTSNKNIDDLK